MTKFGWRHKMARRKRMRQRAPRLWLAGMMAEFGECAQLEAEVMAIVSEVYGA